MEFIYYDETDRLSWWQRFKKILLIEKWDVKVEADLQDQDRTLKIRMIDRDDNNG